MATTIWKGTLHFGTTTIPVKLHAAVRDERIRLHLLHTADGVRLRQQMLCAYEQTPVPAEEQVRGYEVEAGQYLLVEAEELEALVPAENRAIEIHEFVPAGAIDPRYYERSYTLEPEPLAGDYAALVAALREEGVAGLCTWSMRKRAYFGAVQAHGRQLRLATLRHADEVVAVAELGLPAQPLAEPELRIGRELIRQLSAPFRPEQFVNRHEQKLRQLIARKARGEKLLLLKPKQLRPTAPEELLQVLEESLKHVA